MVRQEHVRQRVSFLDFPQHDAKLKTVLQKFQVDIEKDFLKCFIDVFNN